MVAIHSKSVNTSAPRSRFIYITGCDGTGKTTQANLLISHLKEKGRPVRHLSIRFPVIFTAPLLAYARLRGFSWYEGKGITRQGYWDFRHSWLLRSLFPWLYLLDAWIHSITHIRLPLNSGQTIVCERFVLDMLGDLSIALGQPDFHQRLPGRLYLRLLPPEASIVILDLDAKTIRERREDLRYDRRLPARLASFERLAKDQSLQVYSSSLSVEHIQQLIQEISGASEERKENDPA